MFSIKGSFSRVAATILTAIAFGVAASLVSTNSAPQAGANGFTVPIAAGDSGPYSYIVGIWPPEPSVGNLHMAITLTADNRPVTDAEVTVTGEVGDGVAVAGPLPATSFLEPWNYELNMEMNIPGEWTFEIEINSSLGKTVVEAPLEVAGDQETVGQPGPAPARQPSAGEATLRPGQGAELLDLMLTREAATRQPAAAQAANDRAGGSQGVTDPTSGDGGFNWAIIALPLAILAFGVTAWAFRRLQSQQPKPAGGGMTPPSRRRRRR